MKASRFTDSRILAILKQTACGRSTTFMSVNKLEITSPIGGLL